MILKLFLLVEILLIFITFFENVVLIDEFFTSKALNYILNKYMIDINKEDFLFVPLGGSGEIYMNCNLYHYDNSWVMIDLGVMFGNSNHHLMNLYCQI